MDSKLEGYQFRDPAPKTIEFMQDTSKRLTNFEITMHDVQNDIKNIKESLSCNSSEHKEITNLIKDFVESADKKFVNYDVFSPIRKLVYGAVGVVGTIVISSLIYLIFKERI